MQHAKPDQADPLAGRWYPAHPDELRRMLAELWPRHAEPYREDWLALVVPHAGYAFSGRIAAETLACIPKGRYRRILMLGPSHRFALSNRLALPDTAMLQTVLGPVPVDTGAVDAIRATPCTDGEPAAHRDEHCLRILLPLLQYQLGEPFCVIPVLCGALDDVHGAAFARTLRSFLTPETLLLVSTDFTHYGAAFEYVPFRDQVQERLRALDGELIERLLDRDAEGFQAAIERTGATVCGRHPLRLMLRLLPEDACGRRVAYDTSGRQQHDDRHSVSYAGICFRGTPPGRSTGVEPRDARLCGQTVDFLLRLVRRTLVDGVSGQVTPDATLEPEVPEAARQPRAVFVTLKRHGHLRGCIGELTPRLPLWRAVVEQTLNAALHDPRFAPVTSAELDSIRVSLSVLTLPRPIESPEAIQLGRHGIILERKGRRAVFLPQVAPEQGWTLVETLSQLSQKAGLPPDAWQDPETRFQVFEAEGFEECDSGPP